MCLFCSYRKSEQGGILEVSRVTVEMLVFPAAGRTRTPDEQVYLPQVLCNRNKNFMSWWFIGYFFYA